MSPADPDRSEPDAVVPGTADAASLGAETVDRLREKIERLEAIIARQDLLIVSGRFPQGPRGLDWPEVLCCGLDLSIR
jgi:hypothetical protein